MKISYQYNIQILHQNQSTFPINQSVPYQLPTVWECTLTKAVGGLTNQGGVHYPLWGSSNSR